MNERDMGLFLQKKFIVKKSQINDVNYSAQIINKYAYLLREGYFK